MCSTWVELIWPKIPLHKKGTCQRFIEYNPSKHFIQIWKRLHAVISRYVLRSRGISLKSNIMWHFQFSIWLKCPFGEVHFAENSTKIRSVVLRILKTIEYSFFWLYLTITVADFRPIPLGRNTYVYFAGQWMPVSYFGQGGQSDHRQ